MSVLYMSNLSFKILSSSCESWSSLGMTLLNLGIAARKYIDILPVATQFPSSLWLIKNFKQSLAVKYPSLQQSSAMFLTDLMYQLYTLVCFSTRCRCHMYPCKTTQLSKYFFIESSSMQQLSVKNFMYPSTSILFLLSTAAILSSSRLCLLQSILYGTQLIGTMRTMFLFLLCLQQFMHLAMNSPSQCLSASEHFLAEMLSF